MALVHQDSCECVKSELDLFQLPPTQTSIEAGTWVHYHPIAPLNDGGCIEFVVPGSSGEEYIDPAHTLLALTAKVILPEAAAGGALDVAPVNNWAHSLFSQIDISLNQKVITAPTHTYPYRAYIETLLGYDTPAKTSHLTTRLWYKDTGDKFNTRGDDNKGFKTRKAFVAGGKSVELLTNLHCDFFNQDKFLINGVEMRLKLIRSKPEFHLMAPDGSPAVCTITDATLIIRKTKINPSVLLAHTRALESASAKYPVTRVDVKTITINNGLRSKVLDSVYLGQLPKRIVAGFVENTAYNGTSTENPFNFAHHDLSFFSLYVDGVQVPSQPLTPDFTHATAPSYLAAYHTLFSGTGLHFKDEGNSIPREEYPQGYTLYAFDLTPDLSSHTGHWNLQKNGGLRVEVRFKKDLPKAVNLILYSEFDSLIEVDKYRNVQTDYSS